MGNTSKALEMASDDTTSSDGREKVSAEVRDEISNQIKNVLMSVLVLLVDDPTDVSISFTHGERTTIFRVDCSKKSIGRILGRNGRVIDSLRVLSMSISGRAGFRSIIEVPYL